MSRGLVVDNPKLAVAHLSALYDIEVAKVIKAYKAALNGNWASKKLDARYPKITIKIDEYPVLEDRTQAYGYCTRLGTYESTFSRPDILRPYYLDQLTRISNNHPGVEFEIGLSDDYIPLQYALTENVSFEGSIPEKDKHKLLNLFHVPLPKDYPNRVINGDSQEPVYPLSRYNAYVTDRSLLRLKHYTGTNAAFFQKNILFTNYQDYIDEFVGYAKRLLETNEGDYKYLGLVEPGNIVTLNKNVPNAQEAFEKVAGKPLSRLPQMPGYHLVGADGRGITMINIGVGPSNAKTMTDELAPLRPDVMMMVGHCAGLAYTQEIGDYVIPNGFVLEDGIMEHRLGYVDLPELSEIHVALTDAIKSTLEVDSRVYKESVRSGIVTTVADRNWEVPTTFDGIGGLTELERKFAKNKSIALDMETGTIAANAFFHRIPYGALLCVSDKPMHGEPKLSGVAQEFYRKRVKQQFNIMVACVDNLRQQGCKLESRKLFSDFGYAPFR